MTRAVELAQIASAGVSEAYKNRIINGGMVIDQRNSGATVNSTSGTVTRPVDRFFIDNFGSGTVSCARSNTAPAGFSNSLSLSVSATDAAAAGDYLLLSQIIEGFNIADLNWGTSNAQPITVSFWIRNSITGTYGASIRGGSPFQSYPFTYTINAANTWEYKTITIPGPTSGTFDSTNGAGFQIMFDLGSGSDFNGTSNTWQSGSRWRVSGNVSWIANSGASLFITGVQVEVGTSATSFEFRPYGTELNLCQRYLQAILGSNGLTRSSNSNWMSGNLTPPMRVQPTISLDTSGSSANRRYVFDDGQTGHTVNVGQNLTISAQGAQVGNYYVSINATGIGYNAIRQPLIMSEGVIFCLAEM